jgi:uncharacterized Zn finger protein (UPF0148 family)
MEDTCTCPNCGMDNAYFDGVVFVCPDCDHEWSDSSDDEDDDEFDDSPDPDDDFEIEDEFDEEDDLEIEDEEHNED